MATYSYPRSFCPPPCPASFLFSPHPSLTSHPHFVNTFRPHFVHTGGLGPGVQADPPTRQEQPPRPPLRWAGAVPPLLPARVLSSYTRSHFPHLFGNSGLARCDRCQHPGEGGVGGHENEGGPGPSGWFGLTFHTFHTSHTLALRFAGTGATLRAAPLPLPRSSSPIPCSLAVNSQYAPAL